MRTTRKKTSNTSNSVKPGIFLSRKDFLLGIKKAEEGKFYSVQESMEHFDQWLKSKNLNDSQKKTKFV